MKLATNGTSLYFQTDEFEYHINITNDGLFQTEILCRGVTIIDFEESFPNDGAHYSTMDGDFSITVDDATVCISSDQEEDFEILFDNLPEEIKSERYANKR